MSILAFCFILRCGLVFTAVHTRLPVLGALGILWSLPPNLLRSHCDGTSHPALTYPAPFHFLARVSLSATAGLSFTEHLPQPLERRRGLRTCAPVLDFLPSIYLWVSDIRTAAFILVPDIRTAAWQVLYPLETDSKLTPPGRMQSLILVGSFAGVRENLGESDFAKAGSPSHLHLNIPNEDLSTLSSLTLTERAVTSSVLWFAFTLPLNYADISLLFFLY